MKRVLRFLFALVSALIMVGCGSSPTPSETPAQPTRAASSTRIRSTPARQPISTTPAVAPTQPSPPAATSEVSRDDRQNHATPGLKVEGDRTLALMHGRLIDGTGADPLPDEVLVIQGERILAVGPQAAVEVPAGAQIVDVGGATVLPGFINAHVHWGYSEEKLQAWAQGGVTTVRDLGYPYSDSLFSRRDALLEDNRNARLVSAGPLVTVPQGYPIVPWGGPALTVTSPEDASRKIDGLIDDGADIIKIALDSGEIFQKTILILSPQEAAAIVQTAHQRGVPVSAHVTVAQDLTRALDAGVDDIAHMVTDVLPDELVTAMVEDEVYWVPTLELWKRVGYFDRQAVANLRQFVEAGGQVALGTDYAGYSATFDLGMPITEIELMQKAGMTPMQIIGAATQNAAQVCNLDQELGTLEAGKIADVLIVEGDPLEDIHALANVRMVIHNGVVIRGGHAED